MGEIDERDYQKATMSVSTIVDELAAIEADINTGDIQNTTSKGQSYELEPFTFMPSNQYKVPHQIIRDIVN